jgi:adenylosuccinate lyase
MSSLDTFNTPLNSRYASDAMKTLWSPRHRITTWRKLWLWLAESQRELGLDAITEEALDQMRAHLVPQDSEFGPITEEEKKRRHDVMAHVWGFGQVAPAAAGIIHWGATSQYVGCNSDLILFHQGFDILLPKLAAAIHKLSRFAEKYK